MSKDKNPKRTAAREANRQRQFPPDAVCITCGESALVALEKHHPMGAAHEPDLTVPLCKNCHAKATEDQFREGVPLSETDSFFDRVAAILGGLAAFFHFLADSLNRLQDQMRAELGEGD
jgi:hypothetical protein